MSLKCSACGAPFRGGDIDPDTGTATCRYCNAITRIAAADGPPAPAAPPPGAPGAPATTAGPAPLRPRVPQPGAVKVEDWGDRLHIRMRWFSPVFFFLLFFCIFWDGFLVVWYVGVFGAASAAGPMVLCMGIFPLLHVCVGIGLTYYTIAGFLNTTTINVTSSELTVRHGPLPWRGNRRIPTHEIVQLYCDEHVNRNRNGRGGASYRLHALLRDGTKVSLISSAIDRERVLFIEQAIEDHLRLPQRPVMGEIAP